MKAGIVIPTLHHGDAVGNDAIGMADRLRRRGYEVLFFNNGSPSPERVLHVDEVLEILSDPDDLLIYHHSIGFEPGVRAIERAKCRTAVKYHNVTPPHFFRDNSNVARGCEEGIGQVGRLAATQAVIWADSEYNAEHVRSFRPGRVVHELPPFHHADQLLALEPDGRAVAGLDDWATSILCVGRVVPNKNLPLAVEAFANYRQRFNPHARLVIAGDRPVPHHAEEVRRCAEEFEQDGHIFITGKVTNAQLKALYLTADVLLVTSLHEGFCVPLVEAMGLRVPVVAVPNAAVPHTGGEAVRYVTADAASLAEEIDAVLTNEQEREQQTHRGWQRYDEQFCTAAVEQRFEELLDEWLS
ncbi:MAG: glycosyltransferase [Fimbriiglobus sp.]|jgi:glycosyltransferase involved in cell wall biosynthesis|nr:glycosyltransferase [Fimbriiglobus sp.]